MKRLVKRTIDVLPLCAAALLALGLLSAIPTATVNAAGANDARERVFDFALQDINPNSETFGEILRLSDLYAERGVLLNFMASWCRPCREELPVLQSIHKNDRATIVAVAADEYGGPEGLQPLFDRIEMTFPVLFAPEATALKIAEHYPYSIIPATYLIGADGVLRSHYQGLKSKQALRTEIDRHLIGSAR